MLGLSPGSVVPPMTKNDKVPIFLENPDGTITEAKPAGLKVMAYAKRLLGKSETSTTASDSDQSESISTARYQDADILYSRHERVMILLVLLQFSLEALYSKVYIQRMESSVKEFVAMYSWHMRPKAAEGLLWMVLMMQVSYGAVYYGIAVVAFIARRPRHFRLFANWGLLGIIGLVLLAYVDKFNLIIFFTRLLVYVYSKFLQGLTASLLLLPPTSL